MVSEPAGGVGVAMLVAGGVAGAAGFAGAAVLASGVAGAVWLSVLADGAVAPLPLVLWLVLVPAVLGWL